MNKLPCQWCDWSLDLEVSCQIQIGKLPPFLSTIHKIRNYKCISETYQNMKHVGVDKLHRNKDRITKTWLMHWLLVSVEGEWLKTPFIQHHIKLN